MMTTLMVRYNSTADGDGATMLFLSENLVHLLQIARIRHTMRLPLIGKSRSIFIGNLGPFWVYFYRSMANA
jgi:hypothetical protein